jgi:Ferroportin1 (FPN1)
LEYCTRSDRGMTEAEPLVEATTVGAARLPSASPPFVSAGFTESSRSSAVDVEDEPTPLMPAGGSQPPSSSTRAKASPSRMHRLRGSQDRFAADLESHNSTNDHNQFYGNRQDPRQSETRRDWLVLQKARRLLYVSHFFAQFSEVAWQFSLILFLAAITNYQSLVLVSTYGLVAGLSVCLFGSTAGRYVDGTNRLVAAQFFIWTENVCVLIATAFCYRLLQARQDPDEPPTLIPDDATSPMLSSPTWLQSMSQHVPLDHLSLFCLMGIHVFGPIAQILDRGFLVAIERDWVVIMSQAAVEEPEHLSIGPDASLPPCSDPQEDQFQRQAAAMKGWLSETNVTMKQIDLSCKVVAPAIAGFIIGAFDSQQRGSGGGGGGGGGGDDALRDELSGDAALGDRSGSNLKGAAVLVGVVNIIALVVEYYCTRQIYQMIPALAVKCEASDESQSTQLNSGGDSSTSQHGLMQLLPMGLPLPRGRTGGSGVEHWAIVQRPWRVPTALQIYLDQPVSKAGLALSLLYVGFDCPLMIGTALWQLT